LDGTIDSLAGDGLLGHNESVLRRDGAVVGRVAADGDVAGWSWGCGLRCDDGVPVGHVDPAGGVHDAGEGVSVTGEERGVSES